MPATFRISQVTPGAGTAGRSRTDLVAGEVITLEAVSPTGPDVTYLWELTDVVGSAAALTASSGSSVNIGASGGEIGELSSFKIRFTSYDSSTGLVLSDERVACVRSSVTGLRALLFAETAPASGTVGGNTPDLSTDNAFYANLAGTGNSGQNWRGHAQWNYEVLQVLEGLSGGGYIPSGPASGDLSGTYPGPTVAKLQGRAVAVTAPTAGQVLTWNSGSSRWEPQAAASGVTDHGLLTGLSDDDHTQYLLADGTRALSGNLAVGGGVTIDGRDISMDGAALDAHVASTSNPHSTSIANIGSGTLAQLNAAVSDADLVPTTRTVTAGTGLTGGGALSGNITVNAVAHADGSIKVNPDDIQVGVLATDAQHGARGGGTQHAAMSVVAPSPGAADGNLSGNTPGGSLVVNYVSADPTGEPASYTAPYYLIYDDGASETVIVIGRSGTDRTLAAPTTLTWTAGAGRLAYGGPAASGTAGFISSTDYLRIGPGNVMGPTTSTLNALARWAGTVGGALKSSATALTDAGELQVGNGLVTAPSYAYTTDPYTGTWLISTGVQGFAGYGLEVARFQAPSGTLPQALFADGVNTNPSISFASDPDTGIYRDGSNRITFGVGGVKAAQVFYDTTTGGVQVGNGTAAQPSLGFYGDTDNGFWRATTNTVGFVAGGAEQWRMSAGLLAAQGTMIIGQGTANANLSLYGNITTSTLQHNLAIGNGPSGTTAFSGSSGEQRGIYAFYTINQTSTAAFTALKINLTQTALGSGQQAFADFQTGGTSRFVVTSDTTMPGQVLAATGSLTRPTYSFTADPDTGWYGNGGNTMQLVLGGTHRWVFENALIEGRSTSNTITTSSAGQVLTVQGNISTSTGPALTLNNRGTFTGSSADQVNVLVSATANQTSTAGFSLLRGDVTNTALGSGDQNLLDLRVGGTSVFKVKNGATSAIQGGVQASLGDINTPGYGWIGRAGGLYSINVLQTAMTMDTTSSFISFARTGGHNYMIANGGSAGSIGLQAGTTGSAVLLQGRFTTTAGASVQISQVSSNAFSGASVAQGHVSVDSVINQTGTSSFAQLQLSQTQTALGSGTQRFIGASVGGVEKFAVTSDATMPGQVLAAPGSAPRPGLSFLGFPTTGFYSASGTDIRLAFGGLQYSLFQAGSFSTAQNSTNFTFQHNGVRGRWTILARMDNAADTNPGITLGSTTTYIGASIDQVHTDIQSTINQTGTAGFTQLRLRLTETAAGSGSQNFISAERSATPFFQVSAGTAAGRVRASDGSAAFPTYSFLNEPGTGVFLPGAGFLGFSLEGALEYNMEASGFYPEDDGTAALGLLTRRWADVFAVQSTIGDLTMREPHPGKKKPEEIAHWKLVEDLDGIVAYNIRTGKKHRFVMEALPMDEADRAKVQSERERWVH